MLNRHLLLVLAIALLPLAGGCREEAGIEHYTVAPPEREEIRLLAAIVLHKGQVWAFRLSGPAAAVAAEKKNFDVFLATSGFDDDQPRGEPPFKWNVPKGWKLEPGGGLRAASFRIEAKPRELEMTLTPLAGENANLLQNVNRWRRQLNLPPLDAKGLEQVAGPASFGAEPATVVDMTGLGIHSVRPPVVARADAVERPRRRPAMALPFTYETPGDWQKDAIPTGLSVVSFKVGERKDVAVTVTTAGGEWEANVNRWRGQLELAPQSPKELATEVKLLEIAGQEAHYADLSNPASARRDNRILGVILPLGPQTWFLKMTGPAAAVEEHKTGFETFAKSIRPDDQR